MEHLYYSIIKIDIYVIVTIIITMVYTVGVIGVGCVGSAVLKYFQNFQNFQNTPNASTEQSISACGYDKFKEGYNTEDDFNNILQQEILFLCLPTLYNDDMKQYDKTAIMEVCKRLSDSSYGGLVVLKSTVEPGTTNKWCDEFENLDFAHNPEFLTARTAYEAFANQPRVVLGKPSMRTSDFYLEKFANLNSLMKLCWPTATYSYCTSTESESMKSFCNCFYAMKITIFNEFYEMCKVTGANFDKVKEMMLMNGWINPMHTDVPGPDGHMGYGGMCFPKDTSALFRFMQRENLPHRMIEASVLENAEMREE